MGESFLLVLRLPGFPSPCSPTTFSVFDDIKMVCYCWLSLVSWAVLLLVNIVQAVQVFDPLPSSESSHLFYLVTIDIREVAVL